ncbi:MAG: hypothetical protein H0U67_16655 [Gemmatimonadetes bacterium]|jgi:hypothetical protein|nr:hypothetical protein [Gemmatimonadota bacterium]
MSSFWNRPTPLTYRSLAGLAIAASALLAAGWAVVDRTVVRSMEREILLLERRVEDLRIEGRARGNALDGREAPTREATPEHR